MAGIGDWAKIMADKDKGKKVIEYAKKTHNEEILKFLSLMKGNKKDKSTYDLFIKAGSKYEINISAALRKKFTEKEADIGKAPWNDATDEILILFNTNIMKHIS